MKKITPSFSHGRKNTVTINVRRSLRKKPGSKPGDHDGTEAANSPDKPITGQGGASAKIDAE